jgi:hypothetical protein
MLPAPDTENLMTILAHYGIQIPQSAVGPEVATICPKCSSQRKKKTANCLSINTERKVWHCNHCGWAGGLPANQQDSPERSPKPTHRMPRQRPRTGLSVTALDWFARRGITQDVLGKNDIESASVYMPQVREEVESVIFSYFRNGKLINRKYRTIQDKYFRMETGCELVLFGLDDIEADKSLIWVEGEIDKLSCEVAGYRNAVSVPNGAPPPNAKRYGSKFSFLVADWEKIDSVTGHVLAVDADEPGKRLEKELARRLGIEKCRRVRWPEGRKDANDVLIKDGPEDLRWFIEHAEPYPIGESEREEWTSEHQSTLDDADVEGKLRPLTSEGDRIMVCIGHAVVQTHFGKKVYLFWREAHDTPLLEQFFPHYEKYPVNSKAVENYIVAMGQRPRRLDRMSFRVFAGLRAVVYVETVKPSYGSGSLRGRLKPEATHYSKVSEILKPLGYVDEQTLAELRKGTSYQ